MFLNKDHVADPKNEELMVESHYEIFNEESGKNSIVFPLVPKEAYCDKSTCLYKKNIVSGILSQLPSQISKFKDENLDDLKNMV